MKKKVAAFLMMVSCSQVFANNVNWSFPATTLSAANHNASAPQVAVDASGNVIAAWMEGGLVKSSMYPVNMNWGSPVTLSNWGASGLRMVSDLNGNAYAVWLENSVVQAASKPFNRNWGHATAISGKNASFPDLAVDSSGNVVAVWVKKGNIEASTKPFGADWSNRSIISSDGATCPKVAIGGSGANQMATVVWQGVSDSMNVVYAATKPINGQWSFQQVLSDTDHQAANAFVAVDANRNATAVWYRYDVMGSDYSQVVVQTATRSDSGTWSSPLSLSSAGIRNPTTLFAKVAFDSSGNTIALWNNSMDDETFTVASAVCPVRGNWTEPRELVASNLFAYAADAAVTSFGDVLATYMFYNGASLLIQSVESDINSPLTTSWSVPINISSGVDNGYPCLAASLSGNVIHAAVLWLTSNGTNTNVVASVGAKTVVLPPSHLSVTQNMTSFGVFNDYYNTLHWQASSDPSVVGYFVFRNGIFLEQVAANVLQFVDHNRTQGNSVTYGVTAIDSQLSQSRTVTVNFP